MLPGSEQCAGSEQQANDKEVLKHIKLRKGGKTDQQRQ